MPLVFASIAALILTVGLLAAFAGPLTAAVTAIVAILSLLGALPFLIVFSSEWY